MNLCHEAGSFIYPKGKTFHLYALNCVIIVVSVEVIHDW